MLKSKTQATGCLGYDVVDLNIPISSYVLNGQASVMLKSSYRCEKEFEKRKNPQNPAGTKAQVRKEPLFKFND